MEAKGMLHDNEIPELLLLILFSCLNVYLCENTFGWPVGLVV